MFAEARLVFELFLAVAALQHRWLSVLRYVMRLDISFSVGFVAAFLAGIFIVSCVLALMVAQSHGGAVFPTTECTREQSLVVGG